MAPVGVKKRYEDERSELFIAYKVLMVAYNNAIEGSMNQHKKSNNKVDNKDETALEKMVASQLKKITLLGCFSPIKFGFKGTGGSIGSSDSLMLTSSQFSDHQQQAKPKLYQNSTDENDNVAIEENIYQYEKLSTTPQLEQ